MENRKPAIKTTAAYSNSTYYLCDVFKTNWSHRYQERLVQFYDSHRLTVMQIKFLMASVNVQPQYNLYILSQQCPSKISPNTGGRGQ